MNHSTNAVLLLYDILLTFDEELHHIWKGKVNLVSVLHVINRYGRAAACISSIAIFYPLNDNVSRYAITGFYSTQLEVTQAYVICRRSRNESNRKNSCRFVSIFQEITVLIPYISWTGTSYVAPNGTTNNILTLSQFSQPSGHMRFRVVVSSSRHLYRSSG